MKKIMGMFTLFGFLFGCNSSRHQGFDQVSMSKEPSAYVKDRKLYGSIEKSVDVEGATGPGTGSSYASGSYRQSSIKNSEKKSLQEGDSSSISNMYGNVRPVFPSENDANINYIDLWDRNLINKYDLDLNSNSNNPETSGLHSCFWRPPLTLNYCAIN
jgi:hypothetical protein